jgi:hypothetical protein
MSTMVRRTKEQSEIKGAKEYIRETSAKDPTDIIARWNDKGLDRASGNFYWKAKKTA